MGDDGRRWVRMGWQWVLGFSPILRFPAFSCGSLLQLRLPFDLARKKSEGRTGKDQQPDDGGDAAEGV
jgi:hypothetical protein